MRRPARTSASRASPSRWPEKTSSPMPPSHSLSDADTVREGSSGVGRAPAAGEKLWAQFVYRFAF